MRVAVEQALMDHPGVADESLEQLHEVASRLAAGEALHHVLTRVAHLVTDLLRADACFVYVLEGADLVLRTSMAASAESVDRLRLRVGTAVGTWLAAHREAVSVPAGASHDPRCQVFSEQASDAFEAFLSVPILSRGRLVGVINVQHVCPHDHSEREIRLVSMAACFVGAELETARLEAENAQLVERLEERKVIDRAKGILQRDLGVSEEEAYAAIQRQARQRRRSKKEIAEAIIIGDELRVGRVTP
jgi:uroporphyrinogen-III synthase